MASHVPPKKNDASGFVTYVFLVSQADTKIFQANPTLAAGDVKIAIDDGAPANLNTLPVVDADFTKRVKVTLNQAETNGDVISIIFSDAAGAEWCDREITIHTSGQTLNALTVDTIAELAQAAPAATPTVLTALMYLYMIARNKLLTTSDELGIHNDAGTKIVKKPLADDGATFTESKAESGA